MRNIRKRKPPESLVAYRSTPAANWNGYPDRQAALEALCDEQGYLCAYCMGRITPTPKPRTDGRTDLRSHVEHWHPQSNHKNRTLEWTNLLGVCPGEYLSHATKPGAVHAGARAGGPQRIEFCDRIRKNKPLHINPATTSKNLEQVFQYRGNGEIWSDDDGAASDINTLNLNAQRLRENRKGIIDAVIDALPPAPKTWSERTLREALAQWQTRSANIRRGETAPGKPVRGYREYCQVAINFLDKQIRKRHKTGQ